MDKMYMGIIYTIKREGYSRDAIRYYMNKITCTPITYYSNAMIDDLLEKTMIEAVSCNKYPSSIIYDYFFWKHSPYNYSDFEAICAALSNIQVRCENPLTKELEYINGFESMEGFYD